MGIVKICYYSYAFVISFVFMRGQASGLKVNGPEMHFCIDSTILPL